MQARELTETLTILDATGVDGAFVHEFVTAGATFSEEPRYDLDMNAFALVKTYRHGHMGGDRRPVDAIHRGQLTDPTTGFVVRDQSLDLDRGEPALNTAHWTCAIVPR